MGLLYTVLYFEVEENQLFVILIVVFLPRCPQATASFTESFLCHLCTNIHTCPHNYNPHTESGNNNNNCSSI
jgi:hypothetical protein